ncbi:fatty acid desaturase CarF family protein [Hyphomonas sp.]|jgi:ubiquitin-conjugating enzyme E2 variant|uniref:fatty acid desaturase CarF family protein n=1 Tax=Hyphomonas sp. TaxID=87 RepID=UPI0032D9889E
MQDVLLGIGSVLLGLWIADLGTGFFHWLVDNYCDPDWPILGPLHIRNSHRHHVAPLELFHLPPLLKHGGIWLVVGLAAAALTLAGWMNLTLASACLFGGLTNTIHGWSHSSAEENGPVITLCHRIGLFQSPTHHVHHHSGASDTHYCLLTDHMNPVLEGLRVWPRLESILTAIKIPRRWWVKSQGMTAA